MPRKSPSAVLQLKISLRDVEPPIWRRLVVRDTMTLAQLHTALQEAFGWQNYHLYQFTVEGEDFEAPDREATGKNAARTKLRDLRLGRGDSFEYTYDFGDDWQHDVLVEDVQVPTPDTFYPTCIGGERAGPLEDSGGPHHYQDVLRILRHPNHPEFAEVRAWAPADFDPELFDQRATNRILMLVFGKGAV